MSKPVGEGEHARTLAPHFPRDLYAGTARYYARYRVPYPRDLIDDLRRRARVTGTGRLLDLACGPGRAALPLAAFFREVWAVDQEPEMVEAGRAEAERRSVTNVRWMVGRAEEVVASPGSCELITIGEAFHRLDRRLTAARALEWLAPGGGLATMGCFSIKRGEEPWHEVLREVLRKWTDHGSSTRPARPKKSPVPRGADHDREVLRAIGFQDAGACDFPHPYVWTLDSILGNLYSTASLSKQALGGKAERFEAELRRALLAYDSSGRYPESLGFGYSLFRKPGACG